MYDTYLQNKEAGMEDARVDEDCTEVATLKQLICILKEKIVRIEHDHSFIFY